MKKLIIPTLVETYGLIKFWDFDSRPQSSKDDKPNRYRNVGDTKCSRQMRAVSSPSLFDLSSERSHAENDKNTENPQPTETNEKRPISCPNVSVLNKFKKTLGLHKSAPSAVEETADSATAAAEATTSTITAEATCSKNRFGALIWRTSKERRRSKIHRNDKCYSSDSGIQIEFENEKQQQQRKLIPRDPIVTAFDRSTLNSASLCDEDINFTHCYADTGDSKHIRGVRRAQSTKTSNYNYHVYSGDLDIKSKIPKIEAYKERDAPESLPVRSVSQPYGLDTCVENFEDSDSNSIRMHIEGSNYYPIYAEVVHNFSAVGPQELGLERGTMIEILRKEVGPWWFGRIKKEQGTLFEEILDPELGWFPKDFVRVIHCPETDAFYRAHFVQTAHTAPNGKMKTLVRSANVSEACDDLFKVNDDNDVTIGGDRNNITTIIVESPPISPITMPSLDSATLDSMNIWRQGAVEELLNTEINYVKLLTSICEGYLPAMSKRIDIFAPNSIRLIFSNITVIYGFQRKFLDELRKGIAQNQVAKVFLKLHKGFLCYSTYCNSYPRALIELESYDRIKEARIILENCRESENLTEFPLAAHLLAPVQRICRYPLHLAEILKMVTKCYDQALSEEYLKRELEQLEKLDINEINMADTRQTVEMALEAMKSVTEAVNEGKRHSETIARHQANFQNFKGPPLHLHSTRFFLQIDATRQKQNLWSSSYTLFLFDNQLIYCKRDIIKRSQFIYKGRIYVDRCRVVNVRDGRMFGHTIKNALRIYCEGNNKWYDFSFRSANRKQKFLHTLALERQFCGKALYISEMTGFDYALRDRGNAVSGDFSDQSDYEMPEIDCGSAGTRSFREYLQESSSSAGCNDAVDGGRVGGAGDGSVPESPTKGISVTLPKKSKSRDCIGSDSQTNSLGRRRLGNWFRKPKSSNSTPNLSPTHKPLLPIPLITQSKELQLEVINKLSTGNTRIKSSAEI